LIAGVETPGRDGTESGGPRLPAWAGCLG
jgi:hypothetical protein